MHERRGGHKYLREPIHILSQYTLQSVRLLVSKLRSQCYDNIPTWDLSRAATGTRSYFFVPRTIVYRLDILTISPRKEKNKYIYTRQVLLCFTSLTSGYKNKEEFPVRVFNLVSFHSTTVTFIYSGGSPGGQILPLLLRSGLRLCSIFNYRQRIH